MEGGGAFDAPPPQSRDGQKSPVWIGLRFRDFWIEFNQRCTKLRVKVSQTEKKESRKLDVCVDVRN